MYTSIKERDDDAFSLVASGERKERGKEEEEETKLLFLIWRVLSTFVGGAGGKERKCKFFVVEKWCKKKVHLLTVVGCKDGCCCVLEFVVPNTAR